MDLERDSNLRVAIAAPHFSMAMLDVYKGLRSTGVSLSIALYAKNCTSMKVPVEIDLRRASFTLSQFKKKVGCTKGGDLESGICKSRDPITPFQIIARTSVA